MSPEQIREARALCERATEGPWQVWNGWAYEGGGEDLCIGRGDTWLANMDHRVRRCAQITEDGHKEDDCDICSIDAAEITREERDNAAFIAAARTLLPLALDAIEERDAEIARLQKIIADEAEVHRQQAGMCHGAGASVGVSFHLARIAALTGEYVAWPDPGEQVVS